MKLVDQPGKTSVIQVEQKAKLIVNRRPSGEPGVFITASTEGVKFNLTTVKNKIIFDSSQINAMDTPIGKHFQSSMTRWTKIEVSPEGKLLSRKDGGGGGAATPLPNLPEIGPEQLQQLIASLLTNFPAEPAEPVAPGKEWVHKGKTKLGQFGEMNFEISNRYSGDQIVDGAAFALIEFTGSIKGDVQIQGGGRANTLGFEGNKMSGRYFFDKTADIIRASEQVIVMKIENEKLPKTTIEQQITLRLDSMEDNAK